MAQNQDLENGDENLREPLIGEKKEDEQIQSHENGALCMVLLSTFVAVCGAFEFGFCVGYSAPTQYAMMGELHLSAAQYAVFGSILNIGAILGAITCGRVADFLGRKGAMRLSSVVCSLGWLAIYLSLGPVLLDFGRFLTGYGIGILSYVVPVFIGEITPTSLRGMLTSANLLFIASGTSFVYVLGAFVTWRTLALSGIVPCLVLYFGLFFIPESPRWLAMVGQHKEFEAALQQFRGPEADISRETAMIQENLETLQGLPKVTLVNIFDKSNIWPVIVAVGLMAFQQLMGVNGIIFYATNIFRSAGFDPSVGSFVYAVLQIVVCVIGAGIIDTAGRRPLLLASAAGMLLGSLMTALSFLLKAHEMAPDLVPILAVTGVLVYIGFYSMGMGAGPWIIMSEVFPLHIKALGGSLVTFTNWFGAWCISYTFNFLMLWSSFGTFMFDASFCALAIVFIYKLVPETKGKTLEQIHASMSS